MTGRISVEMICKAKVIKSDDNGKYEGACGEVTRPELYYSEWGKLTFDAPEGWHVMPNGTNGDGTKTNDCVIRCPNHCKLVEKVNIYDFDGWGKTVPPHEVKTMEWEDAP